MKYLTIDIETTAIEKEKGDILSFAAVLEDTENQLEIKDLPKFYCIFKHDKLKGEPYALNMNKDLIEIISKNQDKNLIDKENFTYYFNLFLKQNNLPHYSTNSLFNSSLSKDFKKIDLKVAGKNAGTFDIPWLKYHFEHFFKYFNIHHRVLDVGSVVVDFKNDEWIPNLNECMKKVGVKGEVTHNALQDCYDVIKVLRKKY